METIIYLIRHSVPFKEHRGVELLIDNLLEENKKSPLSITGEGKAALLSKIDELKDIDIVYSSDYVRAMSTAKYIAFNNNLKVNVDYRFGERIHGVSSWSELPSDFEEKQFSDIDFKMENGESRREVSERFNLALEEILKANLGKKIAIVSHGTAITFLLMKLGEYKDDSIYFNNEIVMDKSFVWQAPDIFKLTFEDDSLIKINHIDFNL